MNQNPYSPMNPVQSVMLDRARPRAVTLAAVLWIVAGVCWPLGMLVRVLAADPGSGRAEQPTQLVLVLFGFVVLAIGECWLGVLLRAGNWYARLALAFGAVVCETVVLVSLILTGASGPAYGDGADAAWWAVMLLWAVLGPAAFVCSFLPPVNGYLAARR